MHTNEFSFEITSHTASSRVLSDISHQVHSHVYCHNNETCALIANLQNTAQLGGTSYHSPKVTSGSVQQCRNAKDRQTDTQTTVAIIHFAQLFQMRNATIGCQQNGTGHKYSTSRSSNHVLKDEATFSNVMSKDDKTIQCEHKPNELLYVELITYVQNFYL